MHSRGLYVQTTGDGMLDILMVSADTREHWLRSISPMEDMIHSLDMDYSDYRRRVAALRDFPLFQEKLDIPASELEEVICEARAAAALLKAFDPLGYFAVTAQIDAVLEIPDDQTALWLIQTGMEVINALTIPLLVQTRLRNVFDVAFGRTERMTQAQRLNILQSTYPDIFSRYFRVRFAEEDTSVPYGDWVEYAIRSLWELRLLELAMYFRQPRRIARCAHCWGFFLPQTQKETLYCDRVLNEKTCKQLGPKVQRRIDQSNDNALKIYEVLRNRMEARFDRYVNAKKPMNTDYPMDTLAYSEWSDTARDARRAYLEGDITPEEFIALIDRNGEFREFTSEITVPDTGETAYEHRASRNINFDSDQHYVDMQMLDLSEENPQWRIVTTEEQRKQDQGSQRSLIDQVADLTK